MWATSCVCVCVCLLQYDAGPPSNESGHHNDGAALWRTVFCFASLPVKTAPLCLVRGAGKSPCLTGNSDSQQRSTKGTRSAPTIRSFLFFPALLSVPFFCFVLQWSVRMQSSRPFQTEEDNLEGGGGGERGGTVPGMFIESSARRRRGGEGRGGEGRGGRNEGRRRDKDGERGEEEERWMEKIARAEGLMGEEGGDWRRGGVTGGGRGGESASSTVPWQPRRCHFLLAHATGANRPPPPPTTTPPSTPREPSTHTAPALVHSYKQTHTPLLILLISPLSPPR